MKKLKLLQVTHDLKIGGLQKLVVDIALNIDKAKFDVAVCCLRELGPLARELAENNIPIFEINQIVDGKTNYLSFINVYKILKSENIDIIHTHNTNPFIDGGIAAILANTPVRIHTDHAREYPDKKRYMIAERILSGFYDNIVAVSEQTKSDLVKYEKIKPSKIITIQNGVSVKKERFRESNRKNEVPKKKFIIGSVGRLCRAKGYEYLIKSMAYLLEHTDNFELQIVGDGELMDDLMELTRSMNLAGHVSLVGEQNNIDKYYQNFDLFVISSISEGLPLVLLEAMANNIPIVTTNVGGISGVVKHGQSALIVKPYDAEALAENIWLLMQHERLRKEYASGALEIFREQYSMATMMSKYEQLYMGHYTTNMKKLVTSEQR